MQIIITGAANIRSKPSVKATVVSSAYIGQIYDSTGYKEGDAVAGNSKWHELSTGGYLWSGNAKKYEKPTIVTYSQTDWRWSWKYLGHGGWGQTIGNYGCALTCCSMLSGIDPSTLNDYMKRVGGFVNPDGSVGQGATLLAWDRLEKATSGKLKYKSGLGVSYDDELCKAIIKREAGCIVEVWGSNIPMHFVVAIGKGQIIDPLVGKVVPFSTYNPVSLRDIVRT